MSKSATLLRGSGGAVLGLAALTTLQTISLDFLYTVAGDPVSVYGPGVSGAGSAGLQSAAGAATLRET